MRLFAGIPLSSEACDRLATFRLRSSAPTDGLRWSAPEQWHITLQFYGHLEEDRANCLLQQLARVDSHRAEISLDTFGSFPTKGILHAAVAPTPSLLALQAKVAEVSAACGLLPESRPFRPHITLARSKGRSGNASLRRMSHPKLPPFGPPLHWFAPEFVLYESKLRPQGSEYTILARFPLQPALPVQAE